MIFRKNVPYLILYQCYLILYQYQSSSLFLSQDIKQNVLLSFHLGS